MYGIIKTFKEKLCMWQFLYVQSQSVPPRLIGGCLFNASDLAQFPPTLN